MLKKGFTIAELLITLGIVGVLAAMTLPTLMNLKPDDTKIKYINIYNSIATINEAVLEDSTIYWAKYYTSDDTSDSSLLGEPMCLGLACTDKPTVLPYSKMSSWSASQKYARVLVQNLRADEDTLSCSGSKCTFNTLDGVSWEVTFNASADEDEIIKIKVDLNGTEGPNATFSSSQKKPDQFTFNVSAYGSVEPTDKLGKVYLKNAADSTTEDEDKKEAG